MSKFRIAFKVAIDISFLLTLMFFLKSVGSGDIFGQSFDWWTFGLYVSSSFFFLCSFIEVILRMMAMRAASMPDNDNEPLLCPRCLADKTAGLAERKDESLHRQG